MSNPELMTAIWFLLALYNFVTDRPDGLPVTVKHVSFWGCLILASVWGLHA